MRNSAFFSANDMAVLKLATPVKLDTTVQVACLPNTQSNSYPALNSSLVILGWGVVNGGVTPSVLQIGKTNVVSCQNNNDNVYFCTYGSQYTCFGDSGGPLFQLATIGGKSKYALVGTTSGIMDR